MDIPELFDLVGFSSFPKEMDKTMWTKSGENSNLYESKNKMMFCE